MFLLMRHVDWIHPHSLRQSNRKHTVPSSNMFYLLSVEFNAFTSHVLSCLVPPWPFLHTLAHTYTQTVLRIILHVPYPVLVRVCPYLTALSVYLAINRPQGHRLSGCCSKWLGQESSQPSGFLVYSLILLGKFMVFCSYENRKTCF